MDISIKLVIFRLHDNHLQVLLNGNTLPQNPLVTNMSLDAIAQNLFETSTGLPIGNTYLEQLYTFSEKKDVAIVYYLLTYSEAMQTADEVAWQHVANITPEASDAEIIQYAVQRLAWKIEYTNVVYSLLPQQFTLTQLQEAYETILGHTLDKRNFRKKIMSLKFIEPTGEKHVAHARPAQKYRFVSRKPMLVKVFS